MEAYVISHDVGTSSVKSAVVSPNGEVLAHHTTPYPISNPKPGWVEQRPEDYWKGVCHNTREIVEASKVDVNKIVGIVFSTQAMGIIPVDKDGNVLNQNISWVDGRAEEQAVQVMRKIGGKRVFKALTGISLTGKDVIPKLRWIKQNLPDVWEKTESILDVNGYLKFMATGQKVFEWSGACSYGLDLNKKDWERVFFKIAGVDVNKFPPLVKSTDLVGNLTKEAARMMNLPEDIKVYGGCDDTQSAAMGSGANKDGDAHIYLGTSAWLGVTTSKNHKHKNGAVCLQSANPDMNVVVGITESAGSNFDWMINNFYQFEKDSPEVENIYDFIEEETRGIPDGSGHLIFTPWLLGERCPVSSTTTRGTLFNMSLEHKRGHVVKAMLEGIAYNLRWTLENFEKDFKFSVDKIKAIGGGSINNIWMQAIADITGKEVETVLEPQMAGAIGAASCAFVGSGVFKSFDDVCKLINTKNTFLPRKEKKPLYDELFSTYKDLFYSLQKTYKNSNFKRFNS